MTVKKQPVKLNLGCGPDHFKGWVNVDSSPDEKPDVVADVIDLPFEDNSVDEIFASHILEHVDWRVPALEEWHRVLRPGGVIVVIVPDIIGVWYAWKLGHVWGNPVQYPVDLDYINATAFGGAVLPMPYFHNAGHIHRQIFLFDMLIERMRPLFPDAHRVSETGPRKVTLIETAVAGTKP